MAPSPSRQPTLHDVARRAGVHPATVSRALSRPAMVAPATRAAVLAAVESVGFVPNRSARQLVSGRADAIGVLVPDITNPYFASIVRAIQGDARAADLGVLIADTGADPDEERRALATLGRQVDGLVAITPITDLAALAGSGVAVVQVNRASRGVPGVVVDQHAIVAAAAAHLADLGHHDIAAVRGPSAYWSAARRDHAAARLGLRLLGPFPATFDGGRDAFAAIRGTAATAVVAFNDLQAAGILAAARDAGVAVPDELSVVGSDGLDLAGMTSPPLTTVAAPLAELGQAAVATLQRQLAGERPPVRTTLEPHLVVRATTAVPPPRRIP